MIVVPAPLVVRMSSEVSAPFLPPDERLPLLPADVFDALPFFDAVPGLLFEAPVREDEEPFEADLDAPPFEEPLDDAPFFVAALEALLLLLDAAPRLPERLLLTPEVFTR